MLAIILLFFPVSRLCISALRLLKFRKVNEALFAMFDGGRNNEVPKLLASTVPQILCDELDNPMTSSDYMKYTMLAAHR